MKFNELVFTVALAISSQTALADTIEGTIVSVADGDTVTLLTPTKQQVKIRLQGIDAPERKQAFGNVAKQALSEIAFQKAAKAYCPETDRYGRKICSIYVNGRDAGLQMVTQGFAWHYKQYSSTQTPRDRAAYAYAEESARKLSTGLWSDPMAIAPWDFRKQSKGR